MYNKFKRFLKRSWKNIALTLLSVHFVVDAMLWGNAGFTLFKFLV